MYCFLIKQNTEVPKLIIQCINILSGKVLINTGKKQSLVKKEKSVTESTSIGPAKPPLELLGFCQ